MQHRQSRPITGWAVTSLLAAVVAPVTAQSAPDSSTSDAGPGSTLVPLPAVFYQTETGLGFGATVGYFLAMPSATPASSRRQSSVVQVTGLYTLKEQIFSSVRTELFPAGGRYRIMGDIGFVRFPTKFWGVGNDTPDANEEDYTPDRFALSYEAQVQVAPGWYAGAVGQIAHRTLRAVEPGGLLDGGTIPGTDDGTVIGVGGMVSRDTRSSTVYPRSGSYHQLRASVYDGIIGSNYDFGRITLDLRTYRSLAANHVLALRGLVMASPGSPPFDLMPELGGDVLLRGYFSGRFRDRNLVAVEGEYRTTIWSRIGATIFGGLGQVGDSFGNLAWSGFHPAVGTGLRILLSPDEGLNIRADFAYGFDVRSTGFYLGIGEAF